MFRLRCVGATFFLAFIASGSAHASDALVEAAKQCTQYIPFFERQYGVPSHLLSAISSTESGRYHDGLRIVLPYPWAVNAEGKAYYFNSKSEAIAGVKKLQSQGIRSIDIGCMQVNLVHHPNAFGSVEQAFDPKSNVAYAASFLRNLYESEGSWRAATAAYHSKTPERGGQYVGRVFRSWETIISRLRLSRDSTVKQADAGFDGRDMIADLPKSSGIKKTAPAPKATITMVDSGTSEATGNQTEPVKMKVIHVSGRKRNNDIMVYKPKPDNAEPAAGANNDAITIARVDNARTMPVPNAKVMHMGGSKSSPVKVTGLSEATTTNLNNSSGPRFIFSD